MQQFRNFDFRRSRDVVTGELDFRTLLKAIPESEKGLGVRCSVSLDHATRKHSKTNIIIAPQGYIPRLIDPRPVQKRLKLLRPHFKERSRRLWAATEARFAG